MITGMLLFLAALAILYNAGVFYNPSDSLPVGIYRKINRAPRLGDVVAVAKPDNDFTRARPKMRLLLKVLVATAGDEVRIDGNGIRINGVTLAKSKPRTDIPELRAANVYKTLEKDELIVASQYNMLSYDSRYFGVVKTSDIQYAVEPIYTWGTPNESFE